MATNTYKSIFDTSSSSKSAGSSSAGYQSIFDKKPAAKKAVATSGYDINTTEGLTEYAKSKGLEVKEKKPSLFVRAMDIMSRPVYASAGAAKALVRGDENVLKEAWKGLKGEEKETYSDVLKEAGVENKILRGVVGFALDVALDPTTYFGGALLKGVGSAAKVTGRAGMNVTRKFNPLLAASMEATGSSIKDAFGHAFVRGYKTSEGLADSINKYYNKLGMATEEGIEKFRSVFKELPADQHTDFAETLLNFKKKLPEITEKTASRDEAKRVLNRLTPEFKTPEQAKFFKDRYVKLVDEMAEEAGLPMEKRMRAYFPSIADDIDDIKKGMPGKGVGVSDESYKKIYKGLLKNELKKPIEALSRTQAKIVRDNLARETLKEAVDTYGLSKEAFKKLSKKNQAEYRLIRDKKFGKEVGYLKEQDFNFINSELYPEMKTIDLLAKNSGYDAFNRVFKTAVTSYFPAFHIRNALSGFIQNYEVFGARAFDPKTVVSSLGVMKGVDKTLTLGGKKFTGKELLNILKENFGGTSSYIADLGKYIDELPNGNFRVKEQLGKFNPRRLGDFIEMNQKMNGIITGLKQGKTVKEAVKLAEKAGFNYKNLTQFEAKVMRRLIPFYSFMRKNAELQARTLLKNPERIVSQKKFADALSNMFGEKMTEDDLKGVPPWAIEGLGFKIKDNKYMSSLGIPLEEFIGRMNDPLMSTLSSLSPVIKYPLESRMGYDFFRDRKIIDINNVAPATGKLLMDAQENGKMPEWLSNSIRIKSYKNADGVIKYTMNPKALHLLRNIPTSRIQNTFEKIFDKDLDSANKYAALFTGGRIYDIDTEKQKYYTERDLRRDVEDQLIEAGEGKMFQRFYVPKGEE